MSEQDMVRHLRRRLGVHRQRMRYWANLPGSYGPTGTRLHDADFEYEIACCDARAWPGQYDDVSVQLAFEAWMESARGNR